MRIEILHLQSEDAGVEMLMSPTTERAIQLLRERKYDRVAVIETDIAREQYLMGNSLHLDVAWQASNNIDADVAWYRQPCVEERIGDWARSSMVGDVFVAGDMPFLVKSSGFECLVEGRDPI